MQTEVFRASGLDSFGGSGSIIKIRIDIKNTTLDGQNILTVKNKRKDRCCE
jgi:hypothetical protein